MHETGLFELNAVAAISAHRSFRAAATELGISPSPLSHAIAGLEKRLGVRIAGFAPVEFGQVVQRLCDIRVVGTERLLADRQ